MTKALILVAALALMPAQQAATPPPSIDFDAAIREAALRVVAEDAGLELAFIQQRDPETGRFVAIEPGDDEAGYLTMLYGNSYDPAVLAFAAASVAEIYSAANLRTRCAESTIVSCSDPFPSSVPTDVLITAGVYAGVTALQRMAKTQWGVDMDEGWKNLLIFGSIAAVRSLITAANVSDANALRELGR